MCPTPRRPVRKARCARSVGPLNPATVEMPRGWRQVKWRHTRAEAEPSRAEPRTGRQCNTLLRLAGYTLMGRMLGHGRRSIVIVDVPLARVGAGPVVAVRDRSGLLRVRGHRTGHHPRVRMACGALSTDSVCVHQCKESRGQHPSTWTCCRRAGPQHAEDRPGRNHAGAHSRTSAVAQPPQPLVRRSLGRWIERRAHHAWARRGGRAAFMMFFVPSRLRSAAIPA